MRFHLSVVGKTWAAILILLGAGALTAVVSVGHSPSNAAVTMDPPAAAAREVGGSR